MKDKELKIWLINKFNSCYIAQHYNYPGVNFYYYDESYIRKQKLCKLNNQEIKLPSKVNGICLFQKDMNNKLFQFDYVNIWIFLDENSNYKDKYNTINEFIDNTIKETTKIPNNYKTRIGNLDEIKYIDELIII